MDGLGLGTDGTVWGGEFLACDYHGFERLGCLKPVALPGGAAAVREPWRNAYAHLMAGMSWAEFALNFSRLDVFARLEAAPRKTLDAMIAKGINSPLSSSCGRLFDAAAALCGLAWASQASPQSAAGASKRRPQDDDKGEFMPFAIMALRVLRGSASSRAKTSRRLKFMANSAQPIPAMRWA